MIDEQQTTNKMVSKFVLEKAKSGCPVLVRWHTVNRFVKAESFLFGTKGIHAVLIEGGHVYCFDDEGNSRTPSYVNSFTLFMEEQ